MVFDLSPEEMSEVMYWAARLAENSEDTIANVPLRVVKWQAKALLNACAQNDNLRALIPLPKEGKR